VPEERLPKGKKYIWVDPQHVQPWRALVPDEFKDADAGKASEVVGKRHEKSKTFCLPDGRYKAVIGMWPVHYRDNPKDEAEDWKEVDLSVRETPDGRLVVDKCAYVLEIFTDRVGYHYRSKMDGSEVTVELVEVGSKKIPSGRLDLTPNFDGNVLFFNGLLPNLDVKFYIRPQGVEVFRRLHNDRAPKQFKWRVQETPNGHARYQRNSFGADADAKAMRVENVKGAETPLADGRVEYTHEEVWSGEVAEVVDQETRRKEWTQSVVYPAILDASTSELTQSDADDVSEYYDGLHTNSLKMDYYGTPWTYYANYVLGVRFQGVGIGGGANVTTADLKLKVNGIDNDITATVYGDDVDDAAAWAGNSRPTQITETSASVAWDLPTSTGWTTKDIASVVSEILGRGGWASGNDMRFAIGPDGGDIGGAVYFSDYGDGQANAPKLEITYTANQAPTAPTSLECEGGTNPVNVTDTTPEFTAVGNDPDSSDTLTHAEIEVGTSQNDNDMWDSGKLDITNFTEGERCAAISYDGDALSQGVKYYWRIRFWDDDDTAGAWSDGSDYFQLAVALSATSVGDAIVSAKANAIRGMLATAVGDSIVTADANIVRGVIGIAAGDAVTAAALFLTLRLAGTASGAANYRGPPVTVLRNVAAQAVGDSAVSASLNKARLLTATAIGDSAASASANSVRGVKATAVGDSAVSARLNLVAGAKATAVGDSAVSASFEERTPIAATATGDSTVTAALSKTKLLTTTAAGDSAVSAALEETMPAAATAAGDSTVTASLNPLRTVKATVVGDSTVSAALEERTPIAATAAGDSTVTASLNPLRTVKATAVGDSAVSASLEERTPIAATAAGDSAVTAALNPLRTVKATAVGDSAVSARLNPVRTVKATAVGDSAASADANIAHGVIGTAVGDSAVSATITKFKPLTATAVGDSAVSADLLWVWTAQHPAHEVVLYNSSGVQQSRLRKWAAVEYTVRCSNVGDCSISAHKDVNGADDLVSDNRVEIYRRGNRVFAGRFDWENPSYGDSGDPSAFRTTRGADFNRLPRRHVLRNAGSACTAAPDDVMKHFARYAWGGSAAASRQLSGFSVAANEAAALGTYHIAGEPQDTAMDVIERVGKACSVDWWVNADVANGTYVFRTGYPRRGSDKSSDIVFTIYRGNVKGFEYTLDTVDKANLAYVGGPGQGSSQTIGTYHAGTAEATGWDRWEAFVRAPDAEYADELTVYGSAYLSTFGSGVAASRTSHSTYTR